MDKNNNNFENIIQEFNIAFTVNDVYQHTKKYSKNNKSFIGYFSELKNDYQIILVNEKNYNQKDKEIKLKKIKSKLAKKTYKTDWKILDIIISDKYLPISINENVLTIQLSKKGYKSEIKNIFPDLDYDADFDYSDFLKDKTEINQKVINNRNASDINKKNNSIKNVFVASNASSRTMKKFKAFSNKAEIVKSYNFLFLLIFCNLLPLAILIMSTFYFRISYLAQSSVFVLIFGAANHDLIIGANQWWRIFTYPFITDNFFTIFLNIILLFISFRYVEIVIGKKNTTLLLFTLYPLIGLCFSMISYSTSLSGPLVLYGLVAGAAIATAYKKKDFGSILVKDRIVMMILYLIISAFIFLMSGEIFTSVILALGLILGLSFGFLINHNYNQLGFMFYAPLAIIVSIFLLTIAITIYEAFKIIIPQENPNVEIALGIYKNWGLFSAKDFNSFINNYYHS